MLATTTAVAVISEMPCALEVLIGAMAKRGAGERQPGFQNWACRARKIEFTTVMKTTSSKFSRGLIILVMLLVPAVSWWVSLRYQEHQQAEKELAAEWRQQADRLKMIEDKYASAAKENDAFRRWVEEKQQPGSPRSAKEWLQKMEPDSIEFSAKPMRTSWNGQTDPDSVWHEQRQRASEMLIRLNGPELDTPRRTPDSPSLPRRLPAR